MTWEDGLGSCPLTAKATRVWRERVALLWNVRSRRPPPPPPPRLKFPETLHRCLGPAGRPRSEATTEGWKQERELPHKGWTLTVLHWLFNQVCVCGLVRRWERCSKCILSEGLWWSVRLTISMVDHIVDTLTRQTPSESCSDPASSSCRFVLRHV